MPFPRPLRGGRGGRAPDRGRAHGPRLPADLGLPAPLGGRAPGARERRLQRRPVVALRPQPEHRRAGDREADRPAPRGEAWLLGRRRRGDLPGQRRCGRSCARGRGLHLAAPARGDAARSAARSSPGARPALHLVVETMDRVQPQPPSARASTGPPRSSSTVMAAAAVATVATTSAGSRSARTPAAVALASWRSPAAAGRRPCGFAASSPAPDGSEPDRSKVG